MRARQYIIGVLLLTLFIPLYSGFSAAASPLDVLIVRDGHVLSNQEFMEDDQFLSTYTDAISVVNDTSSYHVTYDVHTTGESETGPSTQTMRDYDLVLWYTLNDYSDHPNCNDAGCPILTNHDIENIASYLKNEGRMLLTGHRIGFQSQNFESFFRNHFGAQYLSFEDEELFAQWRGKTGDKITAEQNVAIINLSIEGDTESEFGIVDEAGAGTESGEWLYESCSNTGRLICSQQYDVYDSLTHVADDTFKTTFYGFGFEAIREFSGDTPESLLNRTFNFLAGPSTDVTVSPEVTNDTVTFDGICRDLEYRGNGIIDANYEINPSSDMLQNPRDNAGSNDMTFTDGVPGNVNEDIETTYNPADDGYSPTDPLGVNITAAIHCKDDNIGNDGSDNGYWGQFDTHVFRYDIVEPETPDRFVAEDDANATANVPLNMTVDYQFRTPAVRPTEVRFSCSSSGPWTSWKPYDRQADIQYYSFDATDSAYGCSSSDGKKTIHAEVQDDAGNNQSGISPDTVWLDTTPPTFHSITPTNDSEIQKDNLTLNATDSLSEPDEFADTDQALNFLPNGGATFFTINTSFDPEWPGSGLNRIETIIRDIVGNALTHRFHFTIDPFAPTISESPDNASHITSDRNIRLTLNDNITEINVSYYHNESGGNRSFTSGDAFDPGWEEGQEGRRTLDLWVNDSVGNVNTTSYTYFIDNNPPKIIDTTPANDSAIKPTDTLQFTMVDEDGAGIDTVLYSIDTKQNKTYTPNKTRTFSWGGDGDHNITFWSNDTLGHSNSTTYHYTVDSHRPVIDSVLPDRTYLNGTSRLTISTSDPAPSSGITGRTYNNGTANDSFTDSTPFDPGWSTDGFRTLTLWVTDAANNTRNEEHGYTIDTKPPAIDLLDPTNASYLNASGSITPTVSDRGSGSAEPAGLDTIRYSNTTRNKTIQNNQRFDPDLTNEGKTVVTFWLNDTVDNTIPRKRTYFLDTQPPLVTDEEHANNSFITSNTSLSFTVTDSGAGIDTLLYNASTGNNSFTSGQTINPVWMDEIEHTITLWKNDTVQNLNKTGYRYKIDNTPPNATANHTETQTWKQTNQSIELTCDDGPAGYTNSCDITAIKSCIHGHGGSCQPAQEGNIVSVGCVDGRTCNKTLRFRATDRAGNTGSINETYILIDKEAPSIEVNAPANGSLVGGNVTFSIDVTESGVGLDYANYTIVNRSEPSQVFKEAPIKVGDDPAAWWNSSPHDRVNITVILEANDTFDQQGQVNLALEIDNLRPTLTINEPSKRYYNTDVPLQLNASREGDIIQNSTYFVSNGTHIIKHESNTSINQPTHGFIDTVAIADLDDGNYSLNYTAYGGQDRRTLATDWFVVDREAPDVTLAGITNESWQAGSIQFSTTDSDTHLDTESCQYRYSDDGSWHGNSSRSCSSNFSFDTTQCNDDTTADCFIEANAEDLAGNTNRSRIAIKVDNSPPKATISQPADSSWQNSDFPFTFKRNDPQGITGCTYRINSTQGDSGWQAPDDCSSSPSDETVDISNYCSLNGTDVCQVTVNATNNPGTETRAVKTYSIDTETPTLTIERYTDTSNITSDDNFLVTTSDQYAGIDTRVFDNSIDGNQTLPSGTSFDPDIETEQQHSITFWLIDEAGNVLQRENTYFIDNNAPRFHSVSPANTSNISGSDTLTVTYGDNFTGIAQTRYDIGDGFINSFSNGSAFEPSWTTTGSKTIDLRLRDYAENQNITSYTYFLDTDKPLVTNISEENDTVIRPVNLTIDVFDPGLRTTLTQFTHDDVSGYTDFPANTSFDPQWQTEGSHTFSVKLNDTVDNQRLRTYHYTIDNSTPTISSVTQNTSTLRQGETAKISIQASDQYAGIKNVKARLLNQTSGSVTETIPLSKQGGKYVGTYTGEADQDTNLTINISATDRVGFKQFNTEKWLLLDNQEPARNTANVDRSLDPVYNDIRILKDDTVRFTANLTDNHEITTAKTTLERPDATTTNTTLTLKTGTAETGNWTVQINSTGQDGVHNLTTLWVTDTAGNQARLPMTAAKTQFRTVTPATNMTTETTTDAGADRNISITLDYNHTYTGDSRVFLPPNTDGSLESPHLTNTTPLACDNCTLNPVIANGTVQSVNTSATGVENITINATYTIYDPDSDTNITATATTGTLTADDNLTVKAPQPNITAVFCNDSSCTVNQSEAFNLTIQVVNEQDSTHTGAIENQTIDVTRPDGTDKIFNSSTLTSGGSGNTTLETTINTAGNKTIDTAVRVPGTQYHSFSNDTFHITDTENPNATDEAIINDSSLITVNETAYIELTATDNIGVDIVNVTIQKPTATGNESVNTTASLDTGDYTDGTFIAEFNDTGRTGQYNVTHITVQDNYTNLYHRTASLSFTVVERRFTVSTDTQTINASDAVTITANYSGNTTAISTVTANISKPRQTYETRTMQLVSEDNGFIFETVYTNATRSGNYTATVDATAGDTVTNTTAFTVPFGDLTIETVHGTPPITLPESSTVNLTFRLTPENGDTIDTNASYTLGQHLTSTDDTYRDTGNITYEEDRQIETWTVDATGSTSGTSFFDLTVNSTKPVANTSENTSIDFVVQDTQPPSVNELTIVYDTINLKQDQRFYANITDNTVLEEAVLQVTNSTSSTNVSMSYEDVNNLTATYSPGTKGLYNATVFAKDAGDNWARGEITTFNATDIYNLDATTENSVYQKGDTVDITLNVTDINDRKVTGFNATVNLSKAGTEITLLPDNRTDTTNYTITEEDPPTGSQNNEDTYTIEANVSKDGNAAETTATFTVSQILNITFVEPENGEFIAPGEEFNITMKVEDFQGDTSDAISYTTCSVCDTSFRFLQQERDGTYFRAKAFASPDVDSFFTLSGYASDGQGNTQPVNPDGTSSSQISVSTEQTSSGGGGGGGSSGGGGGGGGAGISPPEPLTITRQSPAVTLPAGTDQANLSIRTNLEASCSYQEGSSTAGPTPFTVTSGTQHYTTVPVEAGTTYSYRVTCSSESVSDSEDIVFTVEEEALTTYNLNLPETLGMIPQGDEGEEPFSIFNNASNPITISMTAQTDCCDAWITQEGTTLDRVTIDPGDEPSFRIHTAVPLYTAPSSQEILLQFSSDGNIRERTIPFTVTESTYTLRLRRLNQSVEDMGQVIDQYQEAGIEAATLQQQHQQLVEILAQANTALAENNQPALEEQLRQAEQREQQLQAELNAVAWEVYIRQNWWKWAVTGIIGYLAFFLTTMVFIPYYRIRTDYLNHRKRLESAVEARRKAEKQYFRREIDRKTFMKIMTERQDEILQLRGEIEDLENKLETAITDRLTLEKFIKAPVKAIREINRYLHTRKDTA